MSRKFYCFVVMNPDANNVCLYPLIQKHTTLTKAMNELSGGKLHVSLVQNIVVGLPGIWNNPAMGT